VYGLVLVKLAGRLAIRITVDRTRVNAGKPTESNGFLVCRRPR